MILHVCTTLVPVTYAHTHVRNFACDVTGNVTYPEERIFTAEGLKLTVFILSSQISRFGIVLSNDTFLLNYVVSKSW